MATYRPARRDNPGAGEALIVTTITAALGGGDICSIRST
jgi:hypothetical protein